MTGTPMRRREVLAIFGGAAAASPLAATAQQSAMPVIGYVRTGARELSEHLEMAFRQGLSETGYLEGRNVQIEYRFAEGRYDRLAGMVARKALTRRDAGKLGRQRIGYLDFAIPFVATAHVTHPSCDGERQKIDPASGGEIVAAGSKVAQCAHFVTEGDERGFAAVAGKKVGEENPARTQLVQDGSGIG